MKKYIQISLILTGFLLLFGSCYKRSDYPDIPHIELADAHKINKGQDLDSFYFTISYLDGDGDLGLAQSDTFAPYNKPPYFYNFFIEYYEKVNGDFRRVKPILSGGNIDTIGYYYRFPVLNSSDKPKTIKGELTVGILHGIAPVYSNIVKFKIYIYDRKLQKSNVVETPEIRR
jgi:hypothetical protein